MSIRETVEDTPLIDNHAHQVTPLPDDLDPETYASYFTEGAASGHARHTIHYRNGIRLLAEYFGEGTEEELVAARAEVDQKQFSRELLAEVNVSHVLQDTGTPPGSDPEAFADYTDAEIRPIMRIETEIEDVIETTDNFTDFETEFEARLTDALGGDHVGLKSIIAYRTGLDIAAPGRSDAAKAFHEVSADWTGRVEHPTLLAYTAHLATDIAAEYDAPIQFHSGFGDADAHPQYVDPSYMWEFMNAHSDATIVLLHAGYPYTKTAGYIVSVLENVYLDLGMTVPFIQHGVKSMLADALELGPSSKLLYSSDGFGIPEWHYMGARRMRTDLASLLEELVEVDFLETSQAETIARQLLRENAERIYPL